MFFSELAWQGWTARLEHGRKEEESDIKGDFLYTMPQELMRFVCSVVLICFLCYPSLGLVCKLKKTNTALAEKKRGAGGH